MTFLTIPIKSIQGNLSSATPSDTMPWYDPSQFPVAPGQPTPSPSPKAYRWIASLDITYQFTSSYATRRPGTYDGQDVSVGQWIANTATGAAWQIINVLAKNVNSVTVEIQDIYRYNTFRDPTQLGDGSPSPGYYVIFSVSDAGVPQIDPIPETGVSASFFTNLLSRFEYINLQYDFPLYQAGNNFQINDVIGTDSSSHEFVLASNTSNIPIGRVTSISDTKPGWFTINPVQKITDFLDTLPGDIGDLIYTDVNNPGKLTLDSSGSQIYLKLRNNTRSITYSSPDTTSSPGNVIQLNAIDITLSSPANLSSLVSNVESVSSQTGVNASLALVPADLRTDMTNISGTYGEPLLSTSGTPASATINGVSVTFDISSTDVGYIGYARAAQMATSINSHNIPNIVASTVGTATLVIENTAGGSITVVNTHADSNGINFAGPNSGSGLPFTAPASTQHRVTFTAIDSRAINFLDVIGSSTGDFGLVSVENGVKACGLYIAKGLRNSISTVVANLSALNALMPLIGDTAYVINSDDGQGNNVDEWSMWLFNGSTWIRTSNQDSASTDAKSLEYTLLSGSPANINIGKISTGRRITLITVEVDTVFNGTPPTLSIGYSVINPTNPVSVADGLMPVGLIDLTVTGTYTTSTDILFGTDTPEGDVEITATYSKTNTNTGSAKIIVSYV